MELKGVLDRLNKVIQDNRDLIQNEESTKQFLILPLIRGLGYDTYSPQEVTPEFTADFHKKNEKVDYAISIKGETKIFIEAKTMTNTLEKNTPQLSRYFSTFPEVRVGILTNGIQYKFYTDLTNTNIMDSTPFFIFDIQTYTEEDYNNLVTFTKDHYRYESIRTLAETNVYSSAFRSVIADMFENPSDEFIKLVIKERFKMTVTQQIIATARPLVKKAIHELIGVPLPDTTEVETRPQKTQVSDLPTPLDDKPTRYTEDELKQLGKVEEYGEVTVVLPSTKMYTTLTKIPPTDYSLEKGNPLSDYFIASVLTQGAVVVGYLVGKYENGQQDTTLYTLKADGIERFLTINPELKSTGLINARLVAKPGKNGKETTYYFRSSVFSLSFKAVPGMVSKISDINKFFEQLK